MIKDLDKVLFIEPTRSIEHASKVHEVNETYTTTKRPNELIEETCLNNWSTLAGKREAVLNKTGYKRRPPLPLDIEKQIIAFPTHGLTHFDLNWIFIQHIAYIKDQTITFTNGYTHTFQNLSEYELKRQYERAKTVFVMLKMEGRN